MELSSLLNTQYGFHAAAVGCVIVCALLVYMLGFKSAQEPQFEKLTDDRKPAGKKRKDKNKANGHAVVQSDSRDGGGKKANQEIKSKKEASATKASVVGKKAVATAAQPPSAPLKEIKDTNDNRKSERNKNKPKGGKENASVANKNKKNIDLSTPEDDDGEWEQAVSRRDKRSKKTTVEDIIPQKNDKKKDKKKSDEENEMIPDTKILDELTEIGIDAEAAVEVPAPAAAKPPTPSTPKEQRKSSSKKKKAPPVPAAAATNSEATKQDEAPPSPVAKQAAPSSEGKKDAAKAKGAGDAPSNKNPQVVKEEKVKVDQKVVDEAAVVAGAGADPSSDGANVVFDELGDQWKEAKAPKKSTRKKTRVD